MYRLVAFNFLCNNTIEMKSWKIEKINSVNDGNALYILVKSHDVSLTIETRAQALNINVTINSKTEKKLFKS